MIRINIENPDRVEREYIDAIIAPLVERIRCTKKALNYLNGLPINIEDGEIVSVKTATIAVIKKVDPEKEIVPNRKYSITDFDRNSYEDSVQKYIDSDNNIDNGQITRISELFDQLLANDNDELKNLLICGPNYLKPRFDYFVKELNLIIPDDLFYIKLGFNYESHKAVSDKIKNFYRTNNFIKYCPYCNLDKVEFLQNSQGQVAARHDLDHFFDKASFPLLCFSMYNLIPSDTTCNQTNKGRIEFTEKYHLNPYKEGFNDSLVFKTSLSCKLPLKPNCLKVE